MSYASILFPFNFLGLVSSTIVALGVLQVFFTYFKLQHVRGPLLAALSDAPRLYWVWTKKPFEKHIELHRQYGPLVRLGPNVVSVADPDAIPTIYGFSYNFEKSDFYAILLPYVNGQAMLGTICPMPAELHRQLKKPVARVFSMSNMVSFEKFVDSSIKLLFDRLHTLYSDGKTCDFGLWLELFVYDVLGELTFSKRYGFLEAGKDVDNIIGDVDSHFNMVSLVGQVPWIDTRLKIRPMMSRIFDQPESPQIKFQAARAAERQARIESSDDTTGTEDRDLLARLMDEQKKDPSLPPWAAMMWVATNIGAGSGTTATILRAIFYNLLRSPASLRRLTAEVRDHVSSKSKQEPERPVSWTQCQQLPYLEACVKEAERIHPAVGLPLERKVPPEGATICGQHFKGGTVVGMNAWVVHRDRAVFGEDADEWRPERWLCGKEKRQRMENTLLTFGAGSRVCYGDHFSHLIIYKLVASLIQSFEIWLADPSQEWISHGRWFVRQDNFKVKIKQSDTGL